MVEKVRNSSIHPRATIKKKITQAMVLMTSATLLILGTISSILNYKSTMDSVKLSLEETAKLAASRIEWEIQQYKTLAFETGCIAMLSMDSTPLETKEKIMNSKLGNYNLTEANIIDVNGMNIFLNEDCSEKEYFKEALKGNTYISEPAVDKTMGTLSTYISAPMWKDGIANSEVVGVIMIMPQEDFMNQIMQSIKISKNSGAYMIDSNGITIADTVMDSVVEGQDIETLAKSDSSLKGLARLHGHMRKGESGFGSYKINGITKFLGYAPLSKTNGWSVGVSAYSWDYLQATVISIIISIIIMAASIIIAVFVASRLGSSVGNPIRLYAKRLQDLARGDLHTTVEISHSQDEVGILAQATEKIVSDLKAVIEDVDYILEEMAEGNFAVVSRSKDLYVGDYAGIEQAVTKLNTKLNDTLYRIQEAAQQVEAGAIQLAQNAQSLAEGATDQAGAIEELSATVTNVTQQVEDTTQITQDAGQKAQELSEEADVSSRQMAQMTGAMEKISSNSMEIGNIVSNIEGIASQTNLLSLNASIEAARAGEAGRGFAVVADEIRGLADESAQSAVSTRQLIQNALKEIESGNHITEDTSESLKKLVEGIESIRNGTEQITGNSQQQLEAIRQIEQGIEQITGVIQSNSAAAEENSATSQELSAQAASLNGLIAGFTLK